MEIQICFTFYVNGISVHTIFTPLEWERSSKFQWAWQTDKFKYTVLDTRYLKLKNIEWCIMG